MINIEKESYFQTSYDYSSNLQNQSNKVIKKGQHSKTNNILRVVGFVTFPLSATGLTLLALASFPLQLVAQQQEIDKFTCLECRIKQFDPSYDLDEPENPLLHAPEKIIKLIPKLAIFIVKAE